MYPKFNDTSPYTERQTEDRQRWSCEDGGRDERNATRSQRISGAIRAGRDKEACFPIAFQLSVVC